MLGGIDETGCGLTEIACACAKESFVQSSVTCINAGCDAADAAKATEVAVGLCKKNGVDIVVPGAPGGGDDDDAEEPTTSAPAAPETTPAPTVTSATVPETSAPAETTAPATPGDGDDDGEEDGDDEDDEETPDVSSTAVPPVETIGDSGAARVGTAGALVGAAALIAMLA